MPLSQKKKKINWHHLALHFRFQKRRKISIFINDLSRIQSILEPKLKHGGTTHPRNPMAEHDENNEQAENARSFHVEEGCQAVTLYQMP